MCFVYNSGQKEMTAWLDRNITNLTEDVLDTFLNVDENRNISDQTEDVLKTVNVDEKLKGMSPSDEHFTVNGIKTQKKKGQFLYFPT
jgi:hypothetical protein